jgi:hypothetical protein
MYHLSADTILKLGYYVYLLIDPRTEKIFYIGKGIGNRINAHVLGAEKENTKETDKIRTIHEIQQAGYEVGHSILRHGLTEKEALEVESAAIDLIGLEHLTNIVHGHHAFDRGRMTIQDIKIDYEAEAAVFDDPVVLIRINKQYRHGMPDGELYESTRKAWKLGEKVKSIHVACAVYAGIVREVYAVSLWQPYPDDPRRMEFVGEKAPPQVRDKYINKSVSHIWKKGSQNPIKYVEPSGSADSDLISTTIGR